MYFLRTHLHKFFNWLQEETFLSFCIRQDGSDLSAVTHPNMVNSAPGSVSGFDPGSGDLILWMSAASRWITFSGSFSAVGASSLKTSLLMWWFFSFPLEFSGLAGNNEFMKELELEKRKMKSSTNIFVPVDKTRTKCIQVITRNCSRKMSLNPTNKHRNTSPQISQNNSRTWSTNWNYLIVLPFGFCFLDIERPQTRLAKPH